jgi:hypothetical protein
MRNKNEVERACLNFNLVIYAPPALIKPTKLSPPRSNKSPPWQLHHQSHHLSSRYRLGPSHHRPFHHPQPLHLERWTQCPRSGLLSPSINQIARKVHQSTIRSFVVSVLFSGHSLSLLQLARFLSHSTETASMMGTFMVGPAWPEPYLGTGKLG